MKRLCCFLILCFALVFNGFPQQYNFFNYTITEGLSQSVVNCIFQDSKGYIWIGTQNGLNRFDGDKFLVFRFDPSSPHSLSNNWVYAISEDNNGDLWIGTKGGLNKYIRKKHIFHRIDYETGFAHNVAQHSYGNLKLKNGNILINTPPVISIYDFNAQKFAHFKSNFLYDAAVKDVKIPAIEDINGTIWVGCPHGLSAFSPQKKEFYCTPFISSLGDTLTEVNITALFQDQQGQIWAGTTTGLFRSNCQLSQFNEINFELSSGKHFSFGASIREIVGYKQQLIVGTEGNGLFIISNNANGKYIIDNYTSANSAIGHNIVQSLLVDKSGNLWVGTLSGISKTDLKQGKFKLYRNDNSPNSTNLLGNVIAGILKNNDGILWIGNWGQGLNLVNTKTGEVEHFSSQHTNGHYIANDFVHVIFKDANNNIWLGTRNGIFIYEKQKNRFADWRHFFNNPSLPGFNNIRIYQIIKDRQDTYWIGTSNGLYRVDLKQSTVEIFQQQMEGNKKISANLVYNLLEDSEGLIWIATINGLDVYNPHNKTIKHHNKSQDGLSSNFVISLCEDNNKRIWIGTNAALNIFNKQTQKFSYLGEEQGLPSDYIYEIIEDQNNDLWFATGNGLCKYNITKEALQIFTPDDGLQSPEFNLRAASACSDGELIFGGMNGFNTFYPDSLEGNPYVPDIVLTSFKTMTDGKKSEINLEQTNKVILGYKVQSFSIEFAALEFTNPKKNKYAYKMEGVSPEWIDIGNRKFVPFFALPPGEYTFSVKGSNNDGVWNTKGIHLRITVLPPWWRSIYAYSAYLLLFGLAIIIFVRLRERRLQLDKIRLEKKVVERTEQIKEQNRIITEKNNELNDLNRTKDKLFSIIGHDLRNHFNIIIGFSENLLYGHKKISEEQEEHFVSNIYKSSVQAHDLLGNLLTWARLQRNAITFNPEKINAATKIRELLNFHEAEALKKNILIDVFAKENITVNADVNMFSTIVRNLLANAIKFTNNDGEISISLTHFDRFCEITIKDSGIGIPAENLEKIFKIDSNISTLGTSGEKGSGLGLVLCKEFVEKHGGQIWVESAIGEGSSFFFTLPIPFI